MPEISPNVEDPWGLKAQPKVKVMSTWSRDLREGKIVGVCLRKKVKLYLEKQK